MAASFAVTASPASLVLVRGGDGSVVPQEVTFAVTNTGPRTVTGRAVVEPLGSVGSAWLEVLGERERDFEANGTHTFSVRVAPPVGATPGGHRFRLNMVDVHRPDEGEVEGPEVGFEVPVASVEGGPAVPRWLWIVVAAVVLVGGAAVLAVAFWPFGSSERAVPPLVGLTVSEATETAEAAGFTLEVADAPRLSDDVGAGRVAAQEPEAEALAEADSAVAVTLAGAPDVVGMARADAERALRDAGLAVTVAGLRVTGSHAPGRVVSQDPGPSDGVEPGAEVALLVEGVPVPRMVGEHIDDALRMLEGTRLSFEMTSDFRSRRSAGTVTRQSIDGGAVVDPGTTVSLSVAATFGGGYLEEIDPALLQRLNVPFRPGNGPIPPFDFEPVTP